MAEERLPAVIVPQLASARMFVWNETPVLIWR